MIDVKSLPIPNELSVFAQDVRQAVKDEPDFYEGAAIIQAALDARVAELTQRNAELVAVLKVADELAGRFMTSMGLAGVVPEQYSNDPLAEMYFMAAKLRIQVQALASQGGNGGR